MNTSYASMNTSCASTHHRFGETRSEREKALPKKGLAKKRRSPGHAASGPKDPQRSGYGFSTSDNSRHSFPGRCPESRGRENRRDRLPKSGSLWSVVSSVKMYFGPEVAFAWTHVAQGALSVRRQQPSAERARPLKRRFHPAQVDTPQLILRNDRSLLRLDPNTRGSPPWRRPIRLRAGTEPGRSTPVPGAAGGHRSAARRAHARDAGRSPGHLAEVSARRATSR